MENRIYFKQVEEDTDSKFKLVCWPRRSGKTTYIANQIVKSFIRRENLLVVASHKMALENLQYSANQILDENKLIKEEIKFSEKNWYSKSSNVTFASNTELRGFNVDKILIEEGEFIKDKQWRQLFPYLEKTPTEIFFTPFTYKKDDVPLVKDLWDNCSDKWEPYRIDYKFMPNWKEIRNFKSTMDNIAWKTDFLCEWVEV